MAKYIANNTKAAGTIEVRNCAIDSMCECLNKINIRKLEKNGTG